MDEEKPSQEPRSAAESPERSVTHIGPNGFLRTVATPEPTQTAKVPATGPRNLTHRHAELPKHGM